MEQYKNRLLQSRPPLGRSRPRRTASVDFCPLSSALVSPCPGLLLLALDPPDTAPVCTRVLLRLVINRIGTVFRIDRRPAGLHLIEVEIGAMVAVIDDAGFSRLNAGADHGGKDADDE